MILAIDVYYYSKPDEDGNTYCAAGVLFEKFESNLPAAIQTIRGKEPISPYIPGRFKDRELPCIIKLLNEFKIYAPEINTIILDSYVKLLDNNGSKIESLGDALFNELNSLSFLGYSSNISIIGVAKTRFGYKKDSRLLKYCVPVYRGLEAINPLYITSIGCDVKEAAENIKNMFGPNKLPDMLSIADRYSKKYIE